MKWNGLSCKLVLVLVSLFAQPAWAGMQSYGVLGDAGKTNRWVKTVRSSLKKAGVSRLVLPGDNIYSFWRSYAGVWEPWREMGFTFDVVALGNHNKGYDREMAYFQMPGEYFSVVQEDARFIVLNSDRESSVEEQGEFLEQELSAAREKFVFIVYHHPTFTVSKFHDWQEKYDFQLMIRPLISKYRDRITALLVGHDHIATVVDLGGVPMIVSGAAADARAGKRVSVRESGVEIRTRWLAEKGIYWARLDLSAEEDAAWISFYREDKAPGLVCKARIFPAPVIYDQNCQRTDEK